MVPPPDSPSGGSGFELPLPKLRLAAVSPADQPVAEAPAPAPVQEPVAAPPAPAPLVLEPAPAPVAPEPAGFEPAPTFEPTPTFEPAPEPLPVPDVPVEAPPYEPPPAAEAPVPVLDPIVVQPEPVVFQPEPVAVEPEPVFVEPTPVVVTPEPVAVEPEIPAQHLPELAEPAPSVQPIVWDEPAEEPVEPQPALEVGLQVSVYVRLEGGERIEVATIADAEEARTKAQELVTDIRRSEGWPFIAGRYIRPESIVSVDLDASIR